MNSYPSEKFSIARHCLMIPHTRGEAEAIAEAFSNCAAGLYDLDRECLDDEAKNWLITLDRFMNTEGLNDTAGKGLYTIKAESLTTDDKIELSRVIDELADWFHRKFWSED